MVRHAAGQGAAREEEEGGRGGEEEELMMSEQSALGYRGNSCVCVSRLRSRSTKTRLSTTIS